MASRQATEASHRVTLSSLDVVTRQEIAEALDAFAAAAVERERAITHFRDLTLVRNAALEEAAVIAERIRACPFDKGAPRHNLEPEDPCPVCGDLGTWPSLDEGSKCLTAATEIRALKTTT